MKRLNGCIKRGLSVYQQDMAEIVEHVVKIEEVFNTLDPESGLLSGRLLRFKEFKTGLADTDLSESTHE